MKLPYVVLRQDAGEPGGGVGAEQRGGGRIRNEKTKQKANAARDLELSIARNIEIPACGTQKSM